jgi:hypothetical protein
MSFVRFNHVFLALMGLSLASVAISPRIGAAPRVNLQALFAPISVPVRGIASWAHTRFTDTTPRDIASPDTPRTVAQVRQENTELRLAVIELTKQLEHLQLLNADREKLGVLRQQCTPVDVIGADSGVRETLQLESTPTLSLHKDMAVLYSGGLVGRISSAGIGGAQVRLITDEGFGMTCGFGRIAGGRYQSLMLPPALVRGTGNGRMVAQFLTIEQIKQAGLAENDSVVLEDRDWPQPLWGQNVGRVVSITARRSAPGYADVHIEPFANLMQLKEVMVMTRPGDR